MSRLREDCYRLLSACFYPPTPALLEEECCSTLASLLASLAPDAAQSASEAAVLLQATNQQELLVEYSRLFLGPFKLVAPPYGSVWLDQARTVMGASTSRVAACYRSHGLQLADDFHELPDHLAVELEFLSFLCFKEYESVQKNDMTEAKHLRAARQEFITTFLLPWLRPFKEAISTDGEAPFYTAVACCAYKLVKADLTQLVESTSD